MKISARAAMEHLDKIVSEIAKEMLAFRYVEVERHTKEIARLRTALGQIRAHLYAWSERDRE